MFSTRSTNWGLMPLLSPFSNSRFRPLWRKLSIIRTQKFDRLSYVTLHVSMSMPCAAPRWHAMLRPPGVRRRAQLEALATKPDNAIDLSDIHPSTDLLLGNAVRGPPQPVTPTT